MSPSINGQVELLLEIEESLPQWILKRMQVDHFVEHPNQSPSFSTKVNTLIDFTQMQRVTVTRIKTEPGTAEQL